MRPADPRAGELRKAGLEGDMDELRARAFLDLVLGKDSRPRRDGPRPPPGPTTTRRSSLPARARAARGRVRRAGHPDRPAGHRGRPGGPARRAGRAQPGRPLARPRPAAAAARNPKTTWCVTVTDQHGHTWATAAPGLNPGATGNAPAQPAAGRDRVLLHPAGQDGPPGGYAPGGCAPQAAGRT